MEVINVGAIAVELTLQQQRFMEQLNSSYNAAKKFSEDVSKLGRDISHFGQSATMRVTLPVVAAVTAGVHHLAKFEDEMRNTNAISRMTETQLASISERVKELAVSVGRNPAELARGLYTIASAGFKGEAGVKALEASVYGAIAGVANFDAASKTIVGTLNAYHKSVDEVMDVSDIYFKTVEMGQLVYDDLAQGMGQVMGTAYALKVPLVELAAAVAAMTKEGLVPAQAFVSLNALLMQMITPSEELKKKLQEYNYESGAALFQTRGLSGAMEWLNEVTGGQADKLAELGFMTRDIRAAFKLTGDSAATFRTILSELENNRAGATMDAFNEQTKSLGHTLRVVWQGIQLLTEEIAVSMLPTIEGLLGTVRDLIHWFRDLDEGTKKTFANVLLFAAAVGPILKLTGAMVSFAGSLTLVTANAAAATTGLMTGLIPAVSLLLVKLGLITVAFTAAYAAGRALMGLKIGDKTLDERMQGFWSMFMDNGESNRIQMEDAVHGIEAVRAANRARWAEEKAMQDEAAAAAAEKQRIDAEAALATEQQEALIKKSRELELDYLTKAAQMRFDMMSTEEQINTLIEKRNQLQDAIMRSDPLSETRWKLEEQLLSVHRVLADLGKDINPTRDTTLKHTGAGSAAELNTVAGYRAMHGLDRTPSQLSSIEKNTKMSADKAKELVSKIEAMVQAFLSGKQYDTIEYLQPQ